jgi:Sulfotransferase domain
MTMHMVPAFDRGFLKDLTNVFLLRHPARVIASYAKKREAPTLDDIGFLQQAQLFDQVANLTGTAPPVITAEAIRQNPRAALTTLCAALGIPFTEAMLHWPAGPKPYDGVWAPHWYNAVHRSTGFEDPEGPLPDLPAEYQRLADAALAAHDRLAAHAF